MILRTIQKGISSRRARSTRWLRSRPPQWMPGSQDKLGTYHASVFRSAPDDL